MTEPKVPPRILMAGAPLAAALLLFCARIQPGTPDRPDGPDTLAQRDTGTFFFHGAVKAERVRYMVNWGDLAVDTGPAIRSGDTVTLAHAWADTGRFDVICRALDEELRLSEPSDPWSVVVVNLAPDTPGPVAGPESTYRDTVVEFSATTTDPESDLLSYEFNWGDGDTSHLSGYASGAVCRAVHAWRTVGDYEIRVRARDEAGHYSGWSPARMLVVSGR